MANLFPKPPQIRDWTDIKSSFRLIEAWLNQIYKQLKNSTFTSNDLDKLFYQSIGISSTITEQTIISTEDVVEKLLNSIPLNNQEIGDVKQLVLDALILQIAEVN